MVLGNANARTLRDMPKKINDNRGTKDVAKPVALSINEQYAIMNNGIVEVTLTIPEGHMAGIQYGGMENVLDSSRKVSSRGYWDIFWTMKDFNGEDWLHMENFKVITQDDDKVELSFSTQWNGGQNSIPINIDKRFVMLRGSSGLYNYVVLDHDQSFPATKLSQIRVAYKLPDKFNYMVISDDIQKFMPMEQDYKNGQPLAYREAIMWTNSSDPTSKTAVEDKYQYSQDMKDQQVHGWISSGEFPVGFWLIKASTEFYSAGPFKQELTSHMGPISLIDFFSGHYAGQNFLLSVQDGERWQKVIGPYFVYLNKASTLNDPFAQLWSDAKQQLQKEIEKWPYEFPSSDIYAKANQRGSVGGQLLIRDRYLSNELIPASSAWVGLAAPGEEGSWQTETKGYQFWTKADNDGNFIIKGVHEGEYSLFAWVPGFLGEYKHNSNILVHPGEQINLNEVVYEPPRNGPTLWEIGIPDRTAAEFFVPDPSPEYINPALLSNEKNKYRQYGLWDRYIDLYPDNDLVYTVGVSNYTKDWFFAHVQRRTENKDLQPATWQIQFPLNNVNPYGSYTLRISLASASAAQLRVRFNVDPTSRPHFTTRKMGLDNAIARHGIHGLYWQLSFDVSGTLLQNGMNTLYLTQSIASSPFCGVMYDYLRLEGPSS
ncbi:probable rhamnogalacturonate lyase B [Chenopodium quinoa]|nr:probable rhamnogalacturonate lyase B [Chenopodium quinoa]